MPQGPQLFAVSACTGAGFGVDFVFCGAGAGAGDGTGLANCGRWTVSTTRGCGRATGCGAGAGAVVAAVSTDSQPIATVPARHSARTFAGSFIALMNVRSPQKLQAVDPWIAGHLRGWESR